MTEFDFATLEHRLRELAFLNSGVRILLADQRHASREARGAVLRRRRSRPSCSISTAPRRRWCPKPICIQAERDGIGIDVALGWNDSYHENVLCFTNNIPQRDGGTHLAGFRGALTRTVNNYAEKRRALEKEKVDAHRRGLREGLTAILSVKVPDPKFSSQTKDKLVSSEVRPVVESLVNDGSATGSRSIRPRPRSIVGKVIDAAAAREAARKARELTRARARWTSPRCPASSPTARSAIPAKSELFLVEGDSAGGSAKQGRDRAVPGDPAAARQDPQRRARALRQDALAPRRSAR